MYNYQLRKRKAVKKARRIDIIKEVLRGIAFVGLLIEVYILACII